ncbi:DUF4453 domain-containing protein [Yoonia sp. 208BN28-4]|uniref:DUF4453 domain-containing protein n=1 Tax=Yoonia sp. 208BN28-4 TaxID=3126505 RepID=UPI0030B0708C
MTRLFALFLAVLPFTAKADTVCADLWAMRNLAFARAGYCFGSPLGQSVFGSDGCTGTDVTLSEPYDTRAVAAIREMETLLNCAIDTTSLNHDLPDMAARAQMIELPVRQDGESACIGWRGALLYLGTASHGHADTVGAVEAGDDILFQFDRQGPWEYVYAIRNSQRVAEGWAFLPELSNEMCDGWAG